MARKTLPPIQCQIINYKLQITNYKRTIAGLRKKRGKPPNFCCHCEPVRRLAWQSVPPVIARRALPASPHPPPCHCEAGNARRGNLLSVGSCIYQNSLSLRASPQTGVAIRTPCHCEAGFARRTPSTTLSLRGGLCPPWQSPVGWFLRLS